MRSRRRILGTVTVALALAGIGAPAAQADDWFNYQASIVRPDDRDGVRGPGAALGETAVRPDDRGARVSLVTSETVVRPDDRAVRVSPITSETALRPDDRGARVSPVTPVAAAERPDDREGVRGPGAAPDTAPATIVVSVDGFDWTDAGIGAGMALGLVLLGSGMLLVARRHRRPTAAAH